MEPFWVSTYTVVISDDSFYRVWVRGQGIRKGADVGLPLAMMGMRHKAGFRFDKALTPDLAFTFAGGFATPKSIMFWICIWVTLANPNSPHSKSFFLLRGFVTDRFKWAPLSQFP